MINLPITKINNVDVMSSVDLAKMCINKDKYDHKNFMAKARIVIGDAMVNFHHRENYGNNNTRNILMLPEREACLMAMSYSYELQAHVFDQWQLEKNKSPSLPSTKQLALMVIQAEEEKEAALLQLESKTQHVAQLESLFHSGGTIAQFVKQLNGVNSQQVNNWLYLNTKWLYDDNKGKVDKHGRDKPHAWRCAAYARDKYLTETNYNLDRQGMEPMVKYEVQLLADGKKWLFNKYIKNELPMKTNWNGKFTHEKDLK